MTIFTNSGLKKLTELETSILALQAKPFMSPPENARSEYSKLMVQKSLEILGKIKNASTNDWDEKFVQSIKELAMPCVDAVQYNLHIFNAESKELAKLIFAMLENFHTSNDIERKVRWFAHINIEKILENAKTNLKFRFSLYESFETSHNVRIEVKKIIDEIKSLDLTDGLQPSPQSLILFNAGHEYRMNQLNNIPYTSFANEAVFVNRAEPCNVSEMTFSYHDSRGECLRLLLQSELRFNTMLKQQKSSTILRDHLASQFKELHSFEKFNSIVKKLYEKAAGLDKLPCSGPAMFDKTSCPTNLRKMRKFIHFVNEQLKDPNKAPRQMAFEAFKKLTTVNATKFETDHEKIKKNKDVALEDLMTLFNDFRQQFYNFVFSTNETNDPQLFKELNEYEETLKLKVTPEVKSRSWFGLRN